MDKALDQHVRARAEHRCEYCHLPESLSDLGHVVDHIIARQHRGPTTVDNLALACGRCNLHKGPNIAGVDPAPRGITNLFNPRSDNWSEHFEWDGPVLKGRTPIGRTIVEVLAINRPSRVAVRKLLVALGKLSSE